MNKGFTWDGLDGGGAVAVVQSPWEFSGYAKASEQEHRERNTTSIDHKIKQRLNAGKQPARNQDSDEEEEELLEHAWAKGRSVARKRNRDNASEGNISDESGIEEDEGAQDSDEEGEDDLDEDIDEDDIEQDDEEEDVDQDGEEENHDEQGEKDRGQDSTDEDEKEQLDHSQRKKSLDSKKEKPAKAGNTNKKAQFFSSNHGASFNASSFIELNVSRPLLRACDALGYRQPTPIQAACIPLALAGRDICGSAVTGSGKTAAFALPILERLLFRPRRIPAIRVLIITPTRELAVQLHSMIEKLAQFTDIRCCLVVGGLSSKVQEVALRTHPDIVVATPGRMIDHLRNTQSVGLEELAILVLDEADRLLELGFREEIHELVKLCPSRRQTMLFSATMTDEVSELIKLSLKSPVRLSADPSTERPSTLTEEVIRIRAGHEEDKEAIVLSLCSRSLKSKTIIFSGTKVEAHRLKILFGLSGLKSAELHGNLTQAQRLEALEAFRKQEVDFLIATDVAARGLDIIGVESVINLECPKEIKTYVHRVGRTARAGRHGRSVTLMTEQDRLLLKAVAKRAGSKLQKRVVAATSIASWRERIEKMEEDLVQILQQEREEKFLRKAEMEANKAQNMMDYEAEIFARPKKTWFQSQQDKTRIAKEAKGPALKKKAISVDEGEELQKKEKRKAETEKALPRKKRRRLEAARETAEEGANEDENQHRKGGGKKNKNNPGTSLVDIGYRRAKAVKAAEKARQEGRFTPRKTSSDHTKRKKKKKDAEDEMVRSSKPEAGASRRDATNKKPKRKPGVSKRSFKSKARYKRRRK
ncbi:DEAD-box ATP-dependent RNA helicase 28 [Selaginella moellendorffii]|uniref:DEAD-box ATP-dependent RNA helicase 28 n=1 Tax=Selaginella moellendorffii TaxID=88036 RepID=UPI000D1C425C|nr:DEAD-box ATP-dependent RNA helicase 28 [Selaginella moellendorffii]|eukprot:XP_024538523.1 DEAD-box ATP-dependent RNA helicase 28 [Selaginella moellendorffii]